ncbi:hypothetical protein VNO78_08793 [Psophocarpus tetragonolobus]|uniref:Uncharacterized protein n=1 Tax=Psophocarpus tetragonolobus TaxID=3891 RepID=A0AAN9SYL1_PSOTE
MVIHYGTAIDKNKAENIGAFMFNNEPETLHRDWLVVNCKSHNKSSKSNAKFGNNVDPKIHQQNFSRKEKQGTLAFGVNYHEYKDKNLSTPFNYKSMEAKQRNKSLKSDSGHNVNMSHVKKMGNMGDQPSKLTFLMNKRVGPTRVQLSMIWILEQTQLFLKVTSSNRFVFLHEEDNEDLSMEKEHHRDKEILGDRALETTLDNQPVMM